MARADNEPRETQTDPQTFPWYECTNCGKDFQDNGVGSLRCPSCGSENVEATDA